MSEKLANKVAIVTGASKGIGAAIAEHLAPPAPQSSSTTRRAVKGPSGPSQPSPAAAGKPWPYRPT